jgi:uncharacterized repeat protein (TIGR01451 family)
LARLEERVVPTISSVVLPTGGIQVTATGGAGDDTFVIQRDAGGATVSFFENDPTCSGSPACTLAASELQRISVAGGGGSDLLIVDFSGGNPVPAGGLFYDGGSGPGIDTLEVRGGSCDVGSYTPTGPSDGVLTYTGGSIGSATITFAGLEPVVDTTTTTTFTINGTDAAESITLDNGTATGDGRIRVTFSDAESIEFANKTNVVINGGSSTADLGDTVTLSNTEASTGLSNVTVNTGPGVGGSTSGDTVFARSTPAGVTTTINGDGGGDLIRVASLTDTLDGILGPVAVSGGGGSDNLQIGDENSVGPTAGFNYAITSTAVARTGAATINYSGIEVFLLDARNVAPPAGNSISLSAAPGVAYTINAGTGNDIVTVLIGGASGLTINGQAGTDTLVGPNAGATWNLSGFNQGSIGGVVTSYLSFENLTGGSGPDNFVIQGGGVNGTIDGGGGTDTLDYSSVVAPVRVNLGINVTSAASLDGSQETPPNGSVATGTATFTYNAATLQFDVTLTVTGISAADANLKIDIHQAPNGVAGPAIVSLFDATLPSSAGTLTPTANGFTFTATSVGTTLHRGLDPNREAAFLGDLTYIDVRTTAVPSGEIREQIVRQTQTAQASGVATNTGGVVNIENVIGGAGNDSIVGSFAINSLVGGGGNDLILGGPGNDQLVGGSGDDVLIWGNGDGTDVIEGGAGNDTAMVNGAVGATGDQFVVSPNATRVNFQRTNLGLFGLDIGTVETLTINGNNGGDTITVNNLAGVADLTTVNVFGNTENDTFNVQPSPNVTVNVNGGPPTTAPADALTVDLTGTTNPAFTATSTPTGFQGSYTFGNRQPVNFQQIESPSPVPTDLSITKTDDPDPVSAGANLTYTLTVANAGPSDAVTLQLNDSLSTNTTFVSLTPPAGWAVTTPPVGSTGVVTATRATLAASAGPQVFTLVVRVNASLAAGTSISNTATIGSAGPDSNPANNTVIESTAVQTSADLSVTKTADRSSAIVGTNITYTITVTNNGPSDAQNVTFSDRVPANTRIVNATVPTGWTPAPTFAGGVAATRAILEAGSGPQMFTVVVRVTSGTVVSNTATATSVTTDPTPGNNSSTATTPATLALLPIVTGADAGGGPHVKVFDPLTGALRFSFLAYDAGFAGGVRVAVGDVNGDGVPDIITAAGAGGGPHVKVFNGTDLSVIASFFAYDAAFTGGVFVAAGDVNGDGVADVVTGAGGGGGPHVKVFDGASLGTLGGPTVVQSFFAYDASFFGGVRVAAGDTDGQGHADIITAAGPGGGPHVKFFDGQTLAVEQSFFAYDASFAGGVFVAAGDLDNQGHADIITGAGGGGGPHVKVFDGHTLAVEGSFFAFDATFAGGVRVAVANREAAGQLDLIVSGGAAAPPQVKTFQGGTLAPVDSFSAYDPGFLGGVFVG